jgi:4-hydroxythreonine-4-phosphate dehydrogenase
MPPSAPLALTSGDPAGIGPDITLALWARHRDSAPRFVLLAHPEPMMARAEALGLDVPVKLIGDPGEAQDVFDTALPVMTPSAPLGAAVIPGQPESANAAAVLASIDDAIALIARGQASGIVTNPIAKHVLYSAGFAQPGHTEYLGVQAATLAGDGAPWTREAVRPPVMMLVSDTLKVAPVTIHIPLRDVFEALTRELIVETITTVHRALIQDFGFQAPRIAVAGLNPHAGEHGTIGTEDREIIAPAIAGLRAAGVNAFGPLPADTMFHAAARATYDAAITMYHDQGLIPVKTLAFDTGVNCTLGLPFIRTSPDHGTAFEIAGTGKASPSSLLAALQVAAAMARQRASSGVQG